MRTKNLVAGMVAGFTLFCLAGGAHAQLTVSSGSTDGVNCTSGVCTTTKAKATLNVTQLQGLLASSDVQLKPGSLSQDIVIAAAVFWTSSHRLTLDGYRSIAIGKSIQVTGNGALTMTTDDGGTGGTLTYDPAASVTFVSLSSGLTINGKTFTLKNDIASLASAIAANQSGNFALANAYNAKPDGTYTANPIPTEFQGIFDGLNNTISNLKIRVSTGQEVGLFAELGLDGVIRYINLAKVNVKGSGRDMHHVGGLIGEVAPDADSVSYVSVSGKVTGTGGTDPVGVGGVAGSNAASMDHARSSVKSSGVDAGSLVGVNNGGDITDSSASGAVKAVKSVFIAAIGGLVGFNLSGTIQRSFATGAVSAGTPQSQAGGLTGDNNGGIADSYATGAVQIGQQLAGGLMGYNSGTTDRSYSTGSVKGQSGSTLGGLIGQDFTQGQGGTLTFDYWDTTTSGITNLSQGAGTPKNDKGITGLTDSALKSGLPAGFDKSVWAQSSKINGGLPYLIDNPPAK